mgnify:FL=1
MKNLKKVIQENIAKNIKIYTILVIIFILGLIIGIIVVNNAQDAQKAEINDYINTFINDLKNGAKIDYFKLLKTSFENNFFTVLILWFMSSTVIGIPIVYGEIGYKGFCLGYTISSVVATLGTGKGILSVITSMLLHNIIFIPCLLLLAVSGINLYKSIIRDRRKENIKIEIIRHTIFSLIILAVLLIASLIETYISSNLLISIVKYL